MEKKKIRAKVSKKAFWVNLLIIIAVAFIGIWIAYLALAIFTKHGESTKVPKVENMTYTRAIEVLHSKGFNVDIRDSLYREDIKPGFVIEQFPKANSVVKPGRKIFLYINAVHPKEVVIDDGADRSALALKEWTLRQAKSRLMELGFKNIGMMTVLGADDRVVKLTANGKPIFKMQKVPVNSKIVIEVSDGRLAALRDSLFDAERLKELYKELEATDGAGYNGQYLEIPDEPGNEGAVATKPKPRQNAGAPARNNAGNASPSNHTTTTTSESEELEFFEIPDDAGD